MSQHQLVNTNSDTNKYSLHKLVPIWDKKCTWVADHDRNHRNSAPDAGVCRLSRTIIDVNVIHERTRHISYNNYIKLKLLWGSVLFTANRDQCYRNSPPAVTSQVGSTAVTIDVNEIQNLMIVGVWVQFIKKTTITIYDNMRLEHLWSKCWCSLAPITIDVNF